MPVGKNALKRVTNNGYSKVATSAPDMENSIVEKEKSENPKEEVKVTSAKCAPKKNTAPKTKKPAIPKPEIQKLGEEKRPDGFVRYEFGQELPTHLL